MRYSLLNYLSRPKSNDELVCITVNEADAPLRYYRHPECSRVSQAGALVGPLPKHLDGNHPIAGILSTLSTPPADPARDHQVEVQTGLLLCPATGRWYPVRDFIPEILPDHLRNLQNDFEFLRSLKQNLPQSLYAALDNPSLFNQGGAPDEGVKHKLSEIGITSRIDDPEEFFAPGYLSPFNPMDPFQTAYVIRVFGFCISLIQDSGAKVVLDTGCGYAWTTEWLMKSGFEVIGFDITRAYLDVGKSRMGKTTPYLVLGDTENLPLRNNSCDAVLGFDSFHHIPDRKAAMGQFDRILRQDGHVVLAEPNGAHEAHEVSQAVMEKYGILERGMELTDVFQYVAGTNFRNVEQAIPLRISHRERWKSMSNQFVLKHNWSAANLFVINRTPAPHKSFAARVLTVARRFLCGDLP